MSRISFLLYHYFTLLILICLLQVNGQITFLNEPYTTTLLEESPIGISVLTCSAQDLNFASLTGEYSIDSIEFIINPFNGTVSTNSVIDLEAHGSPLVYIFDVTYTSDVGNIGTSTITISITDINDNTPFFTNTSFYITIPEYTPVTTIVYTASATDVDTVSREQSVDGDALTGFNYTVDYGRVLYRIVGGNGSEYFDIDIDSGEIQILDGEVDVDSIPSLTLNISAEDGPGLTTYAVLLITIEDINDNIPMIISPVFSSITLSEAVSVDLVLVDNVTSVDLDHGLNAEIVYSILVSSQPTSFYIHPTTGRVTLVSSLDRDTDSVIRITLFSTDAGVPALSSSINITLYLTDVNDNTPTFSNNTFLIDLMEDIANGSLVYQFSAVDNDEALNGTVRYFLSHPYFFLTPENGELFLIKPLDRETQDEYNFTIIAFDLGAPVANTGSAIVIITVLDMNDNSPTFNSTYFELHLLDTETPIFILSTITAIDIDIGTNGDITYSFTPDTIRPFDIDSITGVITLTQSVTYSLANEWYNYTINAMDSAVDIERRFAYAELAIRVHEVDTSAPVFSQLSYNTTISEDTPVNTIVLNVSATDTDRGLNGEVRYFVVDASTAFCVNDVLEDCGVAGTFGVNPVTGNVYVSSPLDRDIRDTLSFQIIVYDGGFPLPMNDTSDIIIFLTDTPDTPPQFESPSIHTSIYENLPVLTFLTTVIAVDPDTGPAGEFSFRINSTVLDGNMFVINSTTGKLYSNSVFDRELKDFYQISVIAEDFAVIPLTSYLLVNITILDQNDNSPFVLPDYYNRILEAKPIGTIVDSNITVLDNDIDLQAQLTYLIVNISPEDHFTIDTNTGSLYTSIVLDITLISSYNICILSQDSTFPYFNITYCVDIQILDGNFYPPVFSQMSYNTTVLESSLLGFVLVNLVASDEDFSDNNNLIFYYINSTFPAEFNSTFYIDILNGSVSLIGGLDREYIREIIITVFAIDQPRFDESRTTTTNITVYIGDVNEFTPYFLNTNPNITVSEDNEIDGLIYTLYAADGDADAPNNDIIFLLDNSTNSFYFNVDAVTGNVYVQSQLDREQVQSLTLLFYASDRGTPSLNSTFYLHINLSDVNDNSPQLMTTTLYAAENQSPPYRIAFLQPVDNDRGINGSIKSLFLQDNPGNFSLNNVTRELVSFVTFNRENIPSYNLTIVVQDSGKPPLQSIIEIIIFVTDVNDNSPVFQQSSYTVYLREDISIYTYVVNITADDNDIGENAILVYSIVGQSFFRINSDTGEVRLIGMLDFELATEHVLSIYVTDGVFIVETTLTVFVIDVNDNSPQFARGYQFVVKECVSAHTHLETIETTDKDFYPNNTYTEYTLVDSEFFAIHIQTGLLKTLQTFDRYMQRYYVITVIANNTLAETPLYSMLDIPIYIEPVTDRPKFSEQTQNIEINGDINIGSIVYTFDVIEYVGDDVGIIYSILSGNIGDTFFINSTNGELSSQRSLDYYQQSVYALSILAVENNTYRNTTTILNIYVTNFELKFPLLNYLITLTDDFNDAEPFLEFIFYGFDHPLRQTGTLMFEISHGNDDGIFFLADSGAISVVNHSLLQQTTQPISLSVSVLNEDGQTDQTSITITLSSLALIKPVLTFQIFENITNDSFIGFIAVYDNYTIVSGDDHSIFEIRFGDLFVINSELLDYENKSLYTLSLLLQNTTERVFAIIYVELIDVNEFNPVFAAEMYYFTFQFPSEYQNLSFPLTIFDKDSHKSDVITLNIEDNDGLLISLNSNEIVFDEIATNTIKSINISLQTENKITDFAIITVTFQLYTTNTNQPTFNNTIFSFLLSENFPVGSRVDVITATDSDFGIHGQLSYGLSGNHNDRDFIVDPVTGLISVNYPLDYETQTDYSLILYAYDSVSPCYSATTRVTITLQDVNDNYPIFQQDVYTAVVHENTSVGIELLQVLATDADPIFRDANGVITGDFGLVLYSLSPNNTELSISNLEGVVTVGLPLDREITSSYNISVIATDGGGLVDVATLVVELLDVNDNSPLFENTTIKAQLLEHAVVGTRIGLFLATDPDFGDSSVLLYEIIDGNDEGYFYLDPVTNALHANASFDREIIDLFVVRIEARDMGLPQLSSQVDIEICISDINDNSPVFSQSQYNTSIPENLPIGNIVFNVSATDLDTGSNSVLYFDIFGGNGTGIFSINHQNGSLYLDSPLDYENIRFYRLLIQVTDSNEFQPRTDNTTVLIYVINTNDNFPVFSQVNYTVTIPESITADTFIIQVVAFDLDQVNAGLFYRIDFSIDFSAQGRFYIDQNTGDIFVTGPNFDFEDIPRFSFQVFASDTSASPLSTAVIVYVQLENVNDNTPVFQLNTTQFSIRENLDFPYFISNINATDLDGDNVEFSLITFSIESECILSCGDSFQCQDYNFDPNDSILFRLVRNSGELYTNATFDRETRDTFLFIVTASDGVNDPTILCVSISIIDENDNPPIPLQTEYYIGVSENTLAGEFLTPQAVDNDADRNSELIWEINTVSPSFLGFQIHPMLGTLTLIELLDRESVSEYTINITVSDNGISPLQASIIVYVNVRDINDNAPVFSTDSANQTINIIENTIGHVVIQINATDIDSAENATVLYSLSPSAFFSINPLSGELYLVSELDYETDTMHTLIITAMDTGTPVLQSNTTLTISVIDSNDNAPVFSSDTYNTSVMENTAYGSLVDFVYTDSDTLFENTFVNFEIVSVEPNEPNFYISGSELRLTGSLNAETSTVYRLMIQASNDLANHLLTSVTTVFVYVTDLNDNTPIFTSAIFFGYINEASPIGISVLEVTATDFDVDVVNSDISFYLETNANSTFFSINATTGVIELKNSIDFENSIAFTFNVIATDGGVPVLSSTSMVRIAVLDSNDNPPFFTQLFSFSIPENTIDFLGNVTADDVDNSTIIVYTISSAFVYDETADIYQFITSSIFFIDAANGALTLLQPLDRESADTYLVEITITDSQHYTSTNVTVSVTDLNDNTPATEFPTYTVQIYENNAVLDSVFTPVVTDIDFELNAESIFEISPRFPSNGFVINASSGEVLLDFVLDREIQDLYTIEIEITDRGIPALSSYTVVHIQVLDVNDNIPIIPEPSYQLKIVENSPFGLQIETFNATDDDIGANGEFEFFLNDSTLPFEVFKNGTLYIDGVIDFETSKVFNFALFVKDLGTPSLTTSTQLTIQISDTNDNTPFFDNTPLTISISEHTPVQYIVFKLTATDRDSTSNAEYYFTINQGNSQLKFSIDELTGDIFTINPLDFELTDLYELTVMVTDRGTPALSYTDILEIRVVDENDNNPVFSEFEYFISVPENFSLYTSLFRVYADDIDSDDNGLVEFTIDLDEFSIDSTTGEIQLLQELDFGEKRIYSVRITAKDNGIPQQSSMVYLHVNVLDVDDFLGVFPLDEVTIFLSNSISIGTNIFKVSVNTFGDVTANLVYRIIANDLNGFINIDRQTGDVYLENIIPGLTGNYIVNIAVNEEDKNDAISMQLNIIPYDPDTYSLSFTQPSFYFSVPYSTNIGSIVGAITGENVTRFYADSNANVFHSVFSIADNGNITLIDTLPLGYVFAARVFATNSQDTIQSVVTIEVVSTLNSVTQFSTENYYIQLSEALPIGTTFLTVTAVDNDAIDQGISISYTISSGDDLSLFSIDSQTGRMSIFQTIDRETTPDFNLTILAVGNGNGACTVSITIDDVNDNAPYFSEDVYRLTIPSDTVINTVILQAIAYDSDTGRNGEVIYRIVSQPVDELFVLDSVSGEIMLNDSLRDFQSYSFYISAMDRGLPLRLASEVQVYLTIVQPNLYPPVFTTSLPDTMIAETTHVSSLITHFQAIDPDTNSSTGVYFYLNDAESLPFSLSNSGDLFLISQLEYLEGPYYNLTITAADSGIPVLTSVVMFTVFIEDINNHNPVFALESYAISLNENYQIMNSFITVDATDLDATSITYILSINSYTENGDVIFFINPDTGVVMLSNSLDYETRTVHELLITARDHGYPVTQFNSVTLTVTVGNVNDNAPIFPQIFSATIPRLYTAGKFVVRVNASDIDSESFEYSIASGNGDSLFDVDAVTGDVMLIRDVDASAQSVYDIQLLAFDGELSSTGQLRIEISDSADYCYNGLCTSVVPSVTCTTPGCTTCPTNFTISTTSSFCYLYSCFSTDEYLCGELHQVDCIPFTAQCNGACTTNYLLCPADNLCYSNSLSSQTCDTENTICLEGYTLVQYSDSSRVCREISQNCDTPGKVYCDEIGACQNVLNNPSLCQLCSAQEFECPGTKECVSAEIMCCDTSSYFCNITETCISADQTCIIVSTNIAPTIPSKSILMSSALVGSVIGLLLGDDGVTVGLDIQGEEIGIAIIGHSPVDNAIGYWQYLKCRDSATDTYGACSILEYPWRELPATTSVDNAFVLPPNYRFRFIRSQTMFEGSAWLRLHLWDGFDENGVAIRDVDPHFVFLPPFLTDSAYSQEYLYFVILFNPITFLPTFGTANIITFPDIQEDYTSLENNGLLLSQLFGGVDIPNSDLLSTSVILGLPSTESGEIQLSLPTSATTSYFSSVSSTNVIRSRRLSVTAGFLLSDVNDVMGEWQVTVTGRQSDWYPITSILGNTRTLLYVPLVSRIRFIPNEHTHSTPTISVHPWDGTSQGLSIQTSLIRGVTHYVANTLPTQTGFALGQRNAMSLQVVSVLDQPVVINNEVSLPNIPYYIQYQRDEVFVIELEMSIELFMEQQNTLTQYLAVIFHTIVNIIYYEPLDTTKCLASFLVLERQLTLTDISTELELRKDVLSDLGFNINKVSRDTFVGQGYGCFNAALYAPNTGESAGQIASFNGYDGDDDVMGLAILLHTGSEYGIWQYYRSDVPASQYNPLVVNWVTLPNFVSETNAFLLRPSDWVRFTPHPHSHWTSGTAPTLTVRLWDTSVGSYTQENDLYHANTDPYTATVQSTVNPIGLFSSDTITVFVLRENCAGSAGSSMVFDACCVCGGTGVDCVGCNTGSSNPNVTAVFQFDSCLTCGGNGSTCVGCDSVPFSGSNMDEGNICRSNPSENAPGQVSTYFDCAGTPFGLALVDDCNECTEGTTDKAYNYLKDCNEVCRGTASITSCGECTGGDTGLPENYPTDCRGICYGEYSKDSCGVCQQNSNPIDFRDCTGECFGSAKLDQCDSCYGGTSAVTTANTLLDQCGICGGDGTSCIGCDGTVGTELDNCGECGGENCECVKVTQLTPTFVLSGEETYITVDGAGFFFKPDPLSPTQNTDGSYLPLCGGIRQYPGMDIFVQVSCIFFDNTAKEINLPAVTYTDQSKIICRTPEESITGDFYVLIQFEDILNNVPQPRTPINTSIPLSFFYNSVFQLSVESASSSTSLVGVETNLFFDVINFEYFPELSCIIIGFSSCGVSFTDIYVVNSLFIHSGKIMCVIPAAEYPCQVSISVSINDQTAGIIPKRDFPFTFLHPQPVVTQSRLQHNLDSILIQFDQQLFLTTDISNGCSSLFHTTTLTLLGNSLCSFIGTSNKYVLIQLTTDALLNYNSELVWKENSIYAISETNSFPLSIPTNFQIITSLPNPISVISGPELIPFSGSAYFSAKLSYNCGYKPFTFSWDIRASNLDIDISEVSRKLSQLDSSSDILVLDSSDFTAGEFYTLILSVTNSFGVSSQISEKVFVKNLFPTYPITLVSHPVDIFYSDQEFYFYVLIDYPISDIDKYSFVYSWKIEQVLVSNEKIGINLNSLISSSNALFLPSDYLQANFNYRISVSISFIELSRTEIVSKEIYVGTPSPISIISGGDRQIGFNQGLQIDASNSIQHTGLFDWECFDSLTWLPCTNAVNGLTNVLELDTSSLIQDIQPNSLANGGEYIFRLAQASSSHAVTISVQNTNVPELHISPLMYELMGEGIIVITARLYGYEDIMSVYWQCDMVEGQGHVSLSSLPIQYVYTPSIQSIPMTKPVTTVVYRSQWNELNLFVPTSILSLYHNYTFSIHVIGNGDFSSSITLYNNSPPKQGQLILSSTNGQPLTSEIHLEAKGFCGSTLTYEFYYIVGDLSFPIQMRSVTATAIFVPPIINSTQSIDISIFVTVYNGNGKSVSLYKSFTINLLQDNPSNEISSLFQITDLLISNQEIGKAISRVSTLATSLIYEPTLFPPDSTEKLIAVINTLVVLPNIPAFSSLFYLNLVKSLRINSNQVNSYLQLLLRISKDIFSALENIKLSPTRNFPSPTIIQFDQTTVLELINVILEIPMMSSFDTRVLVSIIGDISKILVLTSFFGSQPVNILNSKLDIFFANDYLYSNDKYCISENCGSYIQFPLSLTSKYFDWLCNTDSQYNCNGVGLTYATIHTDEILGNSNIELSKTAQVTIENSDQNITGFFFNFNETFLLTDLIFLSLKNPISAEDIEISEDTISINFELNETQLVGTGLILCLYRYAQSSDWQMESFSPIQTLTNNVNCQYTHFTQYAVARLDYLPIITPTTTPIQTTTPNITTRTSVTTTQPFIGPSISAAVAIVPIIIILLAIIIIVVILLVIFCWWKRKKTRLLELVTPYEDKLSSESSISGDGIYFKICTVSKFGEEDEIGKLQFLPSSRLREIRITLLECLPEHFEKKAFCFLTKHREQIDPGTENNHFLRIVYDSEIWIRFINAKDEAFRTVFCCCGKIAFFECSRCHGQAYCSAECQMTDWDLHKSECMLLTERKRRQDVLKKTQSSVIRTSVDLRQQRDLDQSHTTPKFDTWRAFLQGQGAPSELGRSPLSSTLTVREQPTLTPDTTTVFSRMPPAQSRPLPPILGTIQRPLTRPSP